MYVRTYIIVGILFILYSSDRCICMHIHSNLQYVLMERSQTTLLNLIAISVNVYCSYERI